MCASPSFGNWFQEVLIGGKQKNGKSGRVLVSKMPLQVTERFGPANPHPPGLAGAEAECTPVCRDGADRAAGLYSEKLLLSMVMVPATRWGRWPAFSVPGWAGEGRKTWGIREQGGGTHQGAPTLLAPLPTRAVIQPCSRKAQNVHTGLPVLMFPNALV